MALQPPTIYQSSSPPGISYLVSNNTNYTLYIGNLTISPGASRLIPGWSQELEYLISSGKVTAKVTTIGSPEFGPSEPKVIVRDLLAGNNLIVHNLDLSQPISRVSVRNQAGSDVLVRVVDNQTNQLTIAVAVTVLNATILIN